VTSERDDTPVLITAAERSFDEQHAARKRRYLVMMGLRVPCLILAGVFYQIWWLALAFVVLSVPLPWIAVLIANDGPRRKAEKVNRYTSDEPVKRIESADHPVIDGG